MERNIPVKCAVNKPRKVRNPAASTKIAAVET
jgi:hypothetical protein